MNFTRGPQNETWMHSECQQYAHTRIVLPDTITAVNQFLKQNHTLHTTVFIRLWRPMAEN